MAKLNAFALASLASRKASGSFTRKRTSESVSNGSSKDPKKRRPIADLTKGASAFLTPKNSVRKRKKISPESTTTTNPNKSSKNPRLGG